MRKYNEPYQLVYGRMNGTTTTTTKANASKEPRVPFARVFVFVTHSTCGDVETVSPSMLFAIAFCGSVFFFFLVLSREEDNQVALVCGISFYWRGNLCFCAEWAKRRCSLLLCCWGWEQVANGLVPFNLICKPEPPFTIIRNV